MHVKDVTFTKNLEKNLAGSPSHRTKGSHLQPLSEAQVRQGDVHTEDAAPWAQLNGWSQENRQFFFCTNRCNLDKRHHKS